MKWILTLLLLLLTACKREATPASSEAEALDYVRLVRVAVGNAYYQLGKPIPATACTDDLFGMRKTTKFLKMDSCTARMNGENDVLVAALFNGEIAVVGDAQGVRRVKVSELPEVK